MRKIGDHVVVLGASIGGLLAARVLADAYQRVTVVERDPSPRRPSIGRVSPRADMPMCWCPEAHRSSTSSFRDCSTTLLRVAHRWSDLAEFRFSPAGHRLRLKGRPAQPFICQASRPYLEGHVRARVRALPTVEILDRCEVAGAGYHRGPGPRHWGAGAAPPRRRRGDPRRRPGR